MQDMTIRRYWQSWCFITTFVGSLALAEAIPADRDVATPNLPNKYASPLFEPAERADLTISFPEGSADLAQSTQNDLAVFAESLGEPVRRLRLVIAGWSDKEFSLYDDAHTLQASDVHLAQERIAVVRDFLKRQRTFSEVRTLNMAQPLGAAGSLFETRDAEVKRAFIGLGTKSAELTYLGETLRQKGRPQSVVIMTYSAGRSVAANASARCDVILGKISFCH